MARPTKCTIDLAAFRKNLDAVKKTVGNTKIMALVKADAYGHGLLKIAAEAEAWGIDYLGVAALEEGIALRTAGITVPILCLGALPMGSEILCATSGVEQAVFSKEAIMRLEEACRTQQKIANVHLKIETGMHRTGVRCGTALQEVLDALKACDCVHLKGVFTHFAASDAADEAYTRRQVNEFRRALAQIRENGFSNFLTHSANSGAILSYPDLYFDMVRAGIILYGYYPSNETKRPFDVAPVLSWETAVVAINDVKAGEKISYSGTFQAPHDMRVAVLPVGYGDGYRRLLSNQGTVLIHGRRAPIIGNICMDMTMVDITDIEDVILGDCAVLLGKQGTEEITADELAGLCQTISYEVMLSVTPRVPKEYIHGLS